MPCFTLSYLHFPGIWGGGKDKIMTKETKNRIDKWVSERYEWYLGEVSKNIAKGKMNQYAHDLVIHMIETLYTQSEEKINQMIDDDMLGRWLLIGASQQLRSSTSPFYRTYRQEKSWSREQGMEGSFNNIFERPETIYDDSLMECMKEEMDKLNFYDEAIMTKYWYEELTLQEIHEYYGITKLSLTRDINRVINKIREQCNKC